MFAFSDVWWIAEFPDKQTKYFFFPIKVIPVIVQLDGKVNFVLLLNKLHLYL